MSYNFRIGGKLEFDNLGCNLLDILTDVERAGGYDISMCTWHREQKNLDSDSQIVLKNETLLLIFHQVAPESVQLYTIQFLEVSTCTFRTSKFQMSI